MKSVKVIGSFLWHTHIYFFILSLVIWYPNNTNQLMGYLAMFVASSYTIGLLLLIFRTNLQKFEFILPLALYGGLGWLLIQYFYISGRTDLYWLGVYAFFIALIETIKHLYNNQNLFDQVHKFNVIGHLVATGFVLGVWFFIADFLPFVTEDTLLLILLLLYLGIGIIVQVAIVLRRYKWLSNKSFHTIIAVIAVSAFVILMVSLLLSHFIFSIS